MSAITPGREALLALATDLSNQKLGSRSLAVEMLRRLAANPSQFENLLAAFDEFKSRYSKHYPALVEMTALFGAVEEFRRGVTGDGVREAIAKSYYTQRAYDKNSGAHIVSFGFNSKDDAIALEKLSTTGEPKR